MEDVKDARALVEQRMRDTGFEQDIFDKVMDLLDKLDDDREKLFEDMLSRLEEPNTDGLRDRWATNCEQAEALLDRIEEDIKSLVEDSQANPMSPDERWEAVGPHDFLEGERKIWTQVAQLEVPDAATLISKVLEIDLAMIKQCEEELKNCRNDDTVVQEILRRDFGTITDKAKALLAKYVNLPSGIFRVAAYFIADSNAKSAATDTAKAFEQAAAEFSEASKQKLAAKKVILKNIKMLTDAREQLDEGWIDTLFARGSEAAANWRGIGATGDYRATDWDWVKENVIERGLDTRAEAAKEQSNKLYNELYPTFIKESEEAFKQLGADESTVANFTQDLQNTYKSLNDLIGRENAFMADVTEGSAKQEALAQLAWLQSTIKSAFEMLFAKTKEADDQVKEAEE